MKKTLLFLLAITILSCKKDKNEETSFPIKLYAEKAEVAAETRLYTKSGEIKDAQKIAQLTGKLSYFHAEENQEGKGATYLTFESRDSATFANNEFKFTVKQFSNQFLLTSRLLSISSTPVQDHFRFHLLKHENVQVEGNAELRKEVRVAYGTYKELKVPVFAYQISSSPDGNSNHLFRLGGLVINEFNEGVLPMLGTHDTIAVKTYHVIIKAK